MSTFFSCRAQLNYSIPKTPTLCHEALIFVPRRNEVAEGGYCITSVGNSL